MKYILLVLLSLVSVSCRFKDDVDEKQAKATEQLMKQAEQEIGMPAIVNFQERKLAKMIFELRDQEDLTTYAYIISLEGELIFIGECIGFGLPYSVQYTNPMRIEHVTGRRLSIPQADPNGLFMPEGLSATWLMMVDPKGKSPRPVYVEPEILVSPFKLH